MIGLQNVSGESNANENDIGVNSWSPFARGPAPWLAFVTRIFSPQSELPRGISRRPGLLWRSAIAFEEFAPVPPGEGQNPKESENAPSLFTLSGVMQEGAVAVPEEAHPRNRSDDARG